MSAKIISTYIAAGYTLKSTYSELTITAAGGVGGTGLSAGTVAMVNLGVVDATAAGDAAISLMDGSVTNGSVSQTTALIKGVDGVLATGITTVDNFGTIDATGTALGDYGVYLKVGGSVTNGSAGDSAAQLDGGISTSYPTGSASKVTNFGTILGKSGVGDTVYLGEGGSVTNGSATDLTATIEGWRGLAVANAATTVTNFGSIIGTLASGMFIEAGGLVTNGSTVDTSALIEGSAGSGGVSINFGAGTVRNFGTIINGVHLSGGSVTNGSAADTKALIVAAGVAGVHSYAPTGTIHGTVQLTGTVTNFGTIDDTVSKGGSFGVYLSDGGAVTNGASGDTTAQIEGYVGVSLLSSGTVTNWGTIWGTGGKAIGLNSASDVLNVEAGSTIKGLVFGGGGRLDFAGGAGTLSYLSSGGVTLDGTAATTFSNFGDFEIGGGADFTLTGAGSITASETLDVAGLLTVTGGLSDAGATVGAGALVLDGGTDTFGSGASLLVRALTMSGAATTVDVATALLGYSGVWTQTAGTLSVASGDEVSFSGVGDRFVGTLTGAGTVAFAAGTDLLGGVTVSSAKAVINGATVTLSGSVDLTSTLTATTTGLIIGQTSTGAASLSGGGTLLLTTVATNEIIGAGASAKLANVNDTIKGAGDVGGGSMVLVNDAAAVIDGSSTLSLTIDTGTSTIVNAGLIENTATGGTAIMSAVANSGTLEVTTGTLTLDGAVSGTGKLIIGGGVADVATSIFTQGVTFSGKTGVLELADSQAYTGSVAGLSTTGTNSLDLRDIAFTSGVTTATFSGTATSGVLTVTDGTHTAKIKLTGDYLGSTFTVSSDGNGGTTVVDPVSGASNTAPATSAALVQAIGAFSASEGGSTTLLTALDAHQIPTTLSTLHA